MRKFNVVFGEPNEQGKFGVSIGKYIRFNAVGADKLENEDVMNDMREFLNQRANMIMDANEGCSVHCMDGADGKRIEIPAQEIKADLALHELQVDEMVTGFDKMYAEFEEWKKTQEAFACVQASDFAQVWMTAYRAGEKAEREECAKLCEGMAEGMWDRDRDIVLAEVAAAIRMRSN